MRLRAAFGAAALGLVLVGAVDGGSILVARVSVTDDAKDAGRAAVHAIADRPVDGPAATAAYAAASALAAEHGEGVRREDFLVHPDGSVQVTLTRVAPTLLLDRLTVSRGWTEVASTWVQPASVLPGG